LQFRRKSCRKGRKRKALADISYDREQYKIWERLTDQNYAEEEAVNEELHCSLANLSLDLETVEDKDVLPNEEPRLSRSPFHEVEEQTAGLEAFIGSPAEYFEQLASFRSSFQPIAWGPLSCEPTGDPDTVISSQPESQDYNGIKVLSAASFGATLKEMEDIDERFCSEPIADLDTGISSQPEQQDSNAIADPKCSYFMAARAPEFQRHSSSFKEVKTNGSTQSRNRKKFGTAQALPPDQEAPLKKKKLRSTFQEGTELFHKPLVTVFVTRKENWGNRVSKFF